MPVLTKQLADEIADVAKRQWQSSQEYKQPRMEQIKLNEDYYLLSVKPNLDIPFNDCYPVMYGYVKDMMSKIDDAPELDFTPHKKSAYLITEKIQSAYNKEVKSKEPNAKWRLKDRWAKKNALFSGRGIFKYWSATPDGVWKSFLKVVNHYDFHCEPDGGGDLEQNLFCGEEAIFKTKEDIIMGAKNGIYDSEQAGYLIKNYNDPDHKDNQDDYDNRQNRARQLGLDAGTNNYTGQALFKFVEWYLTYKGYRWYCLFEESTGMWVRVKMLKDIIESNKYPYPTFSTDEDSSMFWNQAPCDPVRILNKTTNRFLNQEVYNREKQNRNQKAYDAKMFLDTEALDDPAVGALIPAKVPEGKSIASGLYEFTVPGMGGTINLVEFLNQFIGSKTGQGPASQGVSDRNKKVGVFYGELDQANQVIGTNNKSYTEMHEELGLMFAEGLYQNLDQSGIEISLMGPEGIEWTKLTRYELRKYGSLSMDINITGGSEEQQLQEVERQRKLKGLSGVASVNPQWRDKEILKQSGYTDEDIKEAFSQESTTSKKLIAQAYEAIEDIEMGRKPKLNRDANTTFMQTIIDYSKSVDISDKLFMALNEYAMAHVPIVVKNTPREAREAVKQFANQEMMVNRNTAQQMQNSGGSNINTPEGIGTSIGNQVTNELTQ